MPLALLLIKSFFFFLKLSSFRAFLRIHNFFIQSLPMYKSCSLSMLLNEGIANIEKPDGICSLTFVVDEYVQDLHKQ